jgi:hypothetical protein
MMTIRGNTQNESIASRYGGCERRVDPDGALRVTVCLLGSLVVMILFATCVCVNSQEHDVCGIVGITLQSVSPSRMPLRLFLYVVSQRARDDAGEWRSADGRHCRLAIVDPLAAGHESIPDSISCIRHRPRASEIWRGECALPVGSRPKCLGGATSWERTRSSCDPRH